MAHVMFREGNTAQAGTVGKAVAHLERQGLQALIWVDANAGNKLVGRYRNAARLARRIGVPEARVFLASRGQPADPLIQEDARQPGARVVGHDRFRDWAEAFSEIVDPGHLVEGRVARGALVLEM